MRGQSGCDSDVKELEEETDEDGDEDREDGFDGKR